MTWPGIEPTTSRTPGERSTTRPPGAVSQVENKPFMCTILIKKAAKQLSENKFLSPRTAKTLSVDCRADPALEVDAFGLVICDTDPE